jgi:uncharacterized membrane protein YcaP (DUF421 family)
LKYRDLSQFGIHEVVIIFENLEMAAPIVRALTLTASAVAWTLLLARIAGLRAFSKATAFDFAATIATGSLIAQAGTRSKLSEYVQAMAAIGAVFLIQYILARCRVHSARFARAIDNSPVLLMEDGRFLEKALRETRVTKATLLEQIRKSGAASIAAVGAIVLEKTGDITVMTKDDFDRELLADVQRF